MHFVFKQLLVATALFTPLAGFCRPIINITTGSSSLTVTPSGVLSSVRFNVTNVSSKTLTNLVYEPNYLRLKFTSITNNPTFTTCQQWGSLAPGQSCIYAVDITAGEKIGQDLFSPRVCAFGGLICAAISCDSTPPPMPTANGIVVNVAGSGPQPPTPFKYLYATATFVNVITKCSINQTTGDIFDCAPTGSGFDGPEKILFSAINPTIAYTINSQPLTPGNGLLTTCKVNPMDGTLNSCSNYSDPLFAGPQGFTIDPTSKFFYVANSGSLNILRASFDAVTGALTSSFSITGAIIPGVPVSIAFNPATNLVYIGSTGTSSISTCNFNSTTGALSGCVSASSPTYFNYPAGIFFNNAGTVAYISQVNGNATVSVCQVPSGNTPATAVLNPANCTLVSDPKINTPQEIALNADNTLAYVGNAGSPTLMAICPVNVAGNFGPCTSASYQFPDAIAGLTLTPGF